jgi:hypothetical protein
MVSYGQRKVIILKYANSLETKFQKIVAMNDELSGSAPIKLICDDTAIIYNLV